MPTHPNAAVIEKFYSSFQRRDAAGMAECYHPDVEFWDPVFLDLRGPRAVAMWRMLCERATDLQLEWSAVQADDKRGSAHWEAKYTFVKTGNKVHNKIDAAFEFEGGKIRRHKDTFDLWRWAGMALGAKGKLLGWLPPVQNAVRAESKKLLESYIRKHGG